MDQTALSNYSSKNNKNGSSGGSGSATPMRKIAKVNEIINQLKQSGSDLNSSLIYKQLKQSQAQSSFSQQPQSPSHSSMQQQPQQLLQFQQQQQQQQQPFLSPILKPSRLNGSQDSSSKLMQSRRSDNLNFNKPTQQQPQQQYDTGMDSILLTMNSGQQNNNANTSGSFEASNYVLACEIERQNSELFGHQKIIENLQETNSQLCGLNASQLMRINNVEKQSQEDKRKINLYETNILMLDENINRLESRLEDKKRELADFMGQLEASKQKIADEAVQKLSQTFLKEQATLEAQNAQLKMQLAIALASHSESDANSKNDFNKLQAKYNQLEQQLNALVNVGNQNQELKEQLAIQTITSSNDSKKLQDVIAEKDKQISTLKSELAELSSTPDAIQSGQYKMQIHQQNQTIESLKQALIALDFKNKEIASVMVKASLTAETATQSCQEMSGEIEVLRISVQCKERECDELYQQLKEMKQRSLQSSTRSNTFKSSLTTSEIK